MDSDPYALLSVAFDASPREIDQARTYAHRILRDMSKSIGREQTAAKATAIDRAWATLRDPLSRSALETVRASVTDSAERSGPDTAVRARASTSGGAPGRVCSICRASPAMSMHFRQRMTRKVIESVSGMYCRTCGLATFRQTTNATLRQGFWRARSIITTIAIVWGNLKERRRISRLQPADDTSLALDPGRPLYLRSGVVTVVVSVFACFLSITQVADLSGLISNNDPVIRQLPIG